MDKQSQHNFFFEYLYINLLYRFEYSIKGDNNKNRIQGAIIMSKHNIQSKIGSIFLVVFLVLSGFFIALNLNPDSDSALAESTWIQKSAKT